MYQEDRELTERLLQWAAEQNPGRWVDHSFYVAKAAETIASALQRAGVEIDPNIAYNCGILHDIGRYKGITPSVVHSYDGYVYMMSRGYSGNAQVCVTHSFPIRADRIET